MTEQNTNEEYIIANPVKIYVHGILILSLITFATNLSQIGTLTDAIHILVQSYLTQLFIWPPHKLLTPTGVFDLIVPHINTIAIGTLSKTLSTILTNTNT